MTRFQALFVLLLRNEHKYDCSWRAVAAHYYNRYNQDDTFKRFEDRNVFEFLCYGGNQLDGIELCNNAADILGIKEDIYSCKLKKK